MSINGSREKQETYLGAGVLESVPRIAERSAAAARHHAKEARRANDV